MTKEELLKKIDFEKSWLYDCGIFGSDVDIAFDAIKYFIIEELEPKTGHWIRVDDTKMKCSNCDIIHLIAQYPNGVIDYCPNCGCRMVESEVKE